MLLGGRYPGGPGGPGGPGPIGGGGGGGGGPSTSQVGPDEDGPSAPNK
jgi:hypothetical protein